MVRKVTTPARTSVATVVPCSAKRKNRSNALTGAGDLKPKRQAAQGATRKDAASTV